MRLKKILLSFVLVAVLSCVSVVSAFAATTTATATAAAKETILTATTATNDSEDSTYFDKETGYQWEKVGKKLYCLTAEGHPVTGWVTFGDYTYYMNKKGAMRTGWILAGGSWFYLYKAEDGMGELVGTLATKTWIDNYYVDESGIWTKTR